MDTEYYVVVVQDIGERLEYEYTDYDKAVHLIPSAAPPVWMPAPAMPCKAPFGKPACPERHWWTFPSAPAPPEIFRSRRWASVPPSAADASPPAPIPKHM